MKCKIKNSVFPISIIVFFLIIADLFFKGAIYRRLPIHFQENIDKYFSK